MTESLSRFAGDDLAGHEFLKNLWSDIFEGQIIASLIIVLFLAIFLLREFIVQNARPGILGDPVVVEAGPDGEEPQVRGADDLGIIAPPLGAPPLAPDVLPLENPLAAPATAVEEPQLAASLADQELIHTQSDDEWSDVSEEQEPSDPIEARERIRMQRERFFRLQNAVDAPTPPRKPAPSGRDAQTPGAGPSTALLSMAPLPSVGPLRTASGPLKRKRPASISFPGGGEGQKVAFALVEPTEFDEAFPPKVVDPTVLPLPPSRSVSQIDFTGVVPKEKKKRSGRPPRKSKP